MENVITILASDKHIKRVIVQVTAIVQLHVFLYTTGKIARIYIYIKLSFILKMNYMGKQRVFKENGRMQNIRHLQSIQ